MSAGISCRLFRSGQAAAKGLSGIHRFFSIVRNKPYICLFLCSWNTTFGAEYSNTAF